MYLFSHIFVFENAKIESLTNMLLYIGALFLLYLGMVTEIIFICNYTRSKAAEIIAGVLMATRFISSILGVLMCKIFDVEIMEAMKGFMSSMATIISPDMSSELMKEAIILGFVGTILDDFFHAVLRKKHRNGDWCKYGNCMCYKYNYFFGMHCVYYSIQKSN